MRQRFAIRLLSGAAFAFVLALGAAGFQPARAETATPAVAEKPFDPAGVDTFSGAFLAGRTADVDKDYKTAISLYRKALELERRIFASFAPGELEAFTAMLRRIDAAVLETA